MRTRILSILVSFVAVLAVSGPASADPDLLAQGRAHQAVADYEAAADAYDAFARVHPNAGEAADALGDAIVLRLGLGQVDQAGADAEVFVRNYGAKRRAQTERMSLAVARHLLDHDDWPGAKKHLESWLSAFDARAQLDAVILARTWLGRALAKLGDARKAEAQYAAARDLYRDPRPVVAAIQQQGGDDRRLAEALTAEGEALFFFAEKKRREVDEIHFPELRGRGTEAEIRRHVGTKVARWVGEKRVAIEAAEREYQRILALQPAPPPRWVIAAGSRVGQMWGRFVAEFRAAPIPRAWKGHGRAPGTTRTYDEVRAQYYSALDDAAEPMKQRAKGAFLTCLRYSAKFQYADAYSDACFHWLSKNYPLELGPLDELAPKVGSLGPALPPAAPLPDPR